MRTVRAHVRRLASSAAVASVIAAGLVVGAPPQEAVAAGSSCAPATILAIDSQGKLTRWIDADPDAPEGLSAGTTAGENWGAMVHLLPDSPTRLFAVSSTGKMHLYNYNASLGRYTGGAEIGHGWGGMRLAVPAGNGVIYTVDTGGGLWWFRYDGSSWSSKRIGQGWGAYTQLVSGGNGVLYGVAGNGDLEWVKHRFPASGQVGVTGPLKVGSSWGGFTNIAGAGDGLIYVTNSAGKMALYNHTAPQTGAATWAGGYGKPFGGGWGSYSKLAVNPDACLVGSPGARPAPASNPYSPTTSTDGWTPSATHVHDEIRRAFPDLRSCGGATRPSDPQSDHSRGNALDCFAGSSGSFPSAAQASVMTELNSWLKQHAGALKLSYVIWQDRIWFPRDGVGSTGTCQHGCSQARVTEYHWDHVHVSVL